VVSGGIDSPWRRLDPGRSPPHPGFSETEPSPSRREARSVRRPGRLSLRNYPPAGRCVRSSGRRPAFRKPPVRRPPRAAPRVPPRQRQFVGAPGDLRAPQKRAGQRQAGMGDEGLVGLGDDEFDRLHGLTSRVKIRYPRLYAFRAAKQGQRANRPLSRSRIQASILLLHSPAGQN
jgi:hypothetical protein